ncbi:MAG TPA: CAP domain-containing protein [Gaiellaceae bacterium]|nr:CAP domain-containing protein [Gaiellaceae bacterium]
MAGRIVVAGALAALCVAVAAPAAVPAARVNLVALDAGVLVQLNAIRAGHGLVPLQTSALLTASAAQHSREMATDGYFEHASADGTVFWKRIARWYGWHGDRYWAVGENLLWSSPAVDAAAAVQLWMGSPDHRANILDPRWRQIGVSALRLPAAPGVYRGLEVTIITTDFGVRR